MTYQTQQAATTGAEPPAVSPESPAQPFEPNRPYRVCRNCNLSTVSSGKIEEGNEEWLTRPRRVSIITGDRDASRDAQYLKWIWEHVPPFEGRTLFAVSSKITTKGNEEWHTRPSGSLGHWLKSRRRRQRRLMSEVGWVPNPASFVEGVDLGTH